MNSLRLCVLILLLMGCAQEPPALPTYTQQEGIVRIVTVSRGAYQFTLQPDSRDSTRHYLITNYADSLKSYFLNQTTYLRELPVMFSGRVLPGKDTVYKPTPTDGSEPAYDLPIIQLTALRRK